MCRCLYGMIMTLGHWYSAPPKSWTKHMESPFAPLQTLLRRYSRMLILMQQLHQCLGMLSEL